MKKLSLFVFLFAFTFWQSVQAEPMEFCGVWVTTVGNGDWPTRQGLSVEQMKREADTYLDVAKELGFNAIFLQSRPMGDAMYPSKIFPWSHFLTGKQGQAPADEFDPLRYWIDGAHQRGMQLHAWCNPYRVTHGRSTKNDLDPKNPAVLNPEWLIEREGRPYLNPGLPEVRKLVTDGLVEIVTNYKDIDGVHFDDYFYPEGIKDEDAETFKKYGGDFQDVKDWRRNNVDLLVKGINDAVKKANPKAQWGISPSGIWANKGDDPARLQHPEGSATRGNSHHFAMYADTRKWVQEGWLDYLVPQIYWHIGFNVADFKTLADWWNDVAKGTKAKIYIGLASYRVNPNSQTEAWRTPDELGRQLDYLKTKPNIGGFVFFTMRNFNRGTAVNKAMMEYFGKSALGQKANKSVYVYLSPSSQNNNIGFGEYLSEEFRMNQLAQHMKRHLLEAGVKVLPDLPPVTKAQLDDPNYNRVSLRDRMNDSMRRAKALEQTEPDALFYHIALHTNAAPSASRGQVRGAEVFADVNNSPAAVPLAEHLLAASVALYHKDNPEVVEKYANVRSYSKRLSRGVKDTVAANLGEARATNTKNGMLFEFCFHDEEHDSKWILRYIEEGEKEGGTNPLAKVLSDALVEHVNQK